MSLPMLLSRRNSILRSCWNTSIVVRPCSHESVELPCLRVRRMHIWKPFQGNLIVAEVSHVNCGELIYSGSDLFNRKSRNVEILFTSPGFNFRVYVFDLRGSFKRRRHFLSLIASVSIQLTSVNTFSFVFVVVCQAN